MRTAASRGRGQRRVYGRFYGLLLIAAALAALLGPSPVAFAQSEGTLPSSKASDRKARAEERYLAGVEAFRARNYRDAVEHFEAADALYPSAAYSYNIALAFDKIGDTGGALKAYRQYLRRRVGAPNSRAVLERIAVLEQRLAEQGLRQLTVTSAPLGAAITIDGASVGTTPWTGEIAPGRHRLRISAKGYASVERLVDLQSTRARDLDFRLARTTEGVVRPQLAPQHAQPSATPHAVVRRD